MRPSSSLPVLAAEGTSYSKHATSHATSEPCTARTSSARLRGQDSTSESGEPRYRFVVHSKGHRVDASYSGIVPDTFKDDAEVVLTGRLGPHGFEVEPNGVMAKCPSKYEANPNSPVKAPEHAKPAVTAS